MAAEEVHMPDWLCWLPGKLLVVLCFCDQCLSQFSALLDVSIQQLLNGLCSGLIVCCVVTTDILDPLIQLIADFYGFLNQKLVLQSDCRGKGLYRGPVPA